MAKTLDTTPATDGYRMPAEFEPHSACWMLWPFRPDTWRAGALPAQEAFVDVATAILRFEPVSMGVVAAQFENARRMLPKDIRVLEISSNDSWMRDVGPTFVVNDRGGLRGVDWGFNAYGGIEEGLYFPWDLDALVARKVLEIERTAYYRAPLITEGGAFHVDGQGTLLAVESSVLNPNRNPGYCREQVETHLKNYLNVDTIIWLPRGVYMDETGGHVDNLCCFIRPAEVLLTWTDDKADPQYLISRKAHAILSRAKDARGRSLTVHKIHQPDPLFLTTAECRSMESSEQGYSRKPGQRLAGSYVNFYLANEGLVVPQFDDPHDGPALRILQRLFPKKSVVGVGSREILIGGGNIHCITQQQPARRR